MSDGDWSREVTVRPPATFAPAGTYRESAEEIYKRMRDPLNSPNGLGSAIQMNVFFINRAGRRIDPEMKKRIKAATAFLQLELKVLRNRANASEKDEFARIWKEFHLDNLPRPVFPPPPKEKQVGGRNGMTSVREHEKKLRD